jgi:hypothetical protein
MLPASLRQWLQPREFRIPAGTGDDPSLFHELFKVSLLNPEARTQPAEPPAGNYEEHTTQLARLGTQLWRLRRCLTDAHDSHGLDHNARVQRHLVGAWEAMADLGLEIIDPTGYPYDAGLSLKALAFQPVPGLMRETVIETVKPGIAFHGTLLQTPEVIVGTVEPANS